MFTTALPQNHHLIRFPHRLKRRVAIFFALLGLIAPAAMAADTGDAGTNTQDQSDIPEFISARIDSYAFDGVI